MDENLKPFPGYLVAIELRKGLTTTAGMPEKVRVYGTARQIDGMSLTSLAMACGPVDQ